MKILMVATNYEAPVGGGGQKSLRTLVDALVAEGHQIVVAALAHDEPGTRLVNGVKVHYLPVHNVFRPVDSVQRSMPARMLYHTLDVFNPMAARDIRRICREERPDVVHTHVITGLSVSIWKAVSGLGIPLVHTLRDQYLLCARSTLFRNGKQCVTRCADCRIFRAGHREWSNYPNGVIGVSQFILDGHLKSGYFEQTAVKRVIYNTRERSVLGVDQVASDRSSKTCGVRFGFIGSLAPSKGVELLLDTFNSLDLPSAELWLAGTGNGSYDRYLHQRYESQKIKFLGRVKQKDFFPNVDVVVVPSLWDEPLGMVVAEAFAFGKPVIGAQRGGIVEMIIPGVNGLLFEPNDESSLSNALIATSDRGGVNEMSDAAIRSSLLYLNVKKYALSHISLYTESIELFK